MLLEPVAPAVVHQSQGREQVEQMPALESRELALVPVAELESGLEEQVQESQVQPPAAVQMDSAMTVLERHPRPAEDPWTMPPPWQWASPRLIHSALPAFPQE